jgi:RNA polymerase sigma factor (TIGR02999 family)
VNNITQLLANAGQGAPLAAEELVPAVYDELRRLAACKMANELPGQTLQPTALVHEAWLRLGADAQPNWQNRGHFFAAAAEAMRRILVERARRHAALKRGAGGTPVSLVEVEIPIEMADDDERLLKVDEVLRDESAQRGVGEVALLRGRDLRGSGLRARHRRAHGQGLVDLRPRLAGRRTERGTSAVKGCQAGDGII